MQQRKLTGPISRIVTVLIGLPAIAAIVLVSSFVYTLQTKVDDAEKSQESVELLRLYNQVTSQLAVERGLSSGVLANPSRGNQFIYLMNQWKETDHQIAKLRQFSTSIITHNKTQHLIEDFLHSADSLPSVREKVENLDLGTNHFLFYSQLNQMLISNAQALNSFGHHPEMTRLNNASLALMIMKEKASKVRGLLNGAFSRQTSDKTEYRIFEQYLMAESEALRILEQTLTQELASRFADIKQSEYWKTVAETVEQYRQQQDFQGKLQGPDAERWFLVASERISMLSELENEILSRMLIVAERQFTQAKNTKNWVVIITVLVCAGLVWGVCFTRNLEGHLNRTTADLIHSIRDLKMTQDQLVQAEKLAALGRLVAGVAHEVNTPLGIAITASSFVDESIQELEQKYNQKSLTNNQLSTLISKAKQSTEILESNLNRAAALIHDFKQTAVDQVSENLSEFNLHQVISALITSLHPETSKVRVVPSVRGNEEVIMKSLPGVLTQVISNLVMNSLSHAFEKQPKPDILISYQQKKSDIVLEYRDNGKGIPKELHNKIFEPFYTTKRGQGGTGLGLNLVFNLVTHKLKGTLQFESMLDKGVHFTLILPKDIEAVN